jgi:hypothetical protein
MLGNTKDISGENCSTSYNERSLKPKPSLKDIEIRLFKGLNISSEE